MSEASRRANEELYLSVSVSSLTFRPNLLYYTYLLTPWSRVLLEKLTVLI